MEIKVNDPKTVHIHPLTNQAEPCTIVSIIRDGDKSWAIVQFEDRMSAVVVCETPMGWLM